MSPEEPSQLLRTIFESHKRQLGIIYKKNHDYASGNDEYKNFRMVNQMLPWIPTEEGIVIRMMDKLARVGNLLHQEAYTTEESIEDTLDDIANYANIIIAFRKSKQEKIENKNLLQMEKNVK